MDRSRTDNKQQKYERNTFIFLTLFIAPFLSIIVVTGLGFAIWFSQIYFGPPTS